MKAFRLAIAVFLMIFLVFSGGRARREPAESRFIVQRGNSFSQVAKGLKAAGIIASYQEFIILGWLTGATRQIKVGEYVFSGRQRAWEVLTQLLKGEAVIYPVTVLEGDTVYDVAALLEEQGLASSEEFLQKAFDSDLLKEWAIAGTSVEGYLYPDTYYLSKGWKPEEIIGKMVAHFWQVFNGRLALRVQVLGWTVQEVVTLASLIEREAAVDWEKPLISAVFHNRLKKGIRLQSDPSAVYGVADFRGRILREDLKRPSEYNTYLVQGLPPGPIGNPGEKSLEGALFPAEVGYLYFVSKNDGTHFFSSSLEEHNRAVARYQGNRVSRGSSERFSTNGKKGELPYGYGGRPKGMG